MLLSESSVSNTVHVSIYDTHANINLELAYHILVKPIRNAYLFIRLQSILYSW